MIVILMLFNLNVYRVKTFLLIFFFQKFLFFFFKKIMSTLSFFSILKTVITKMLLFCEYDSYFYIIR